MSSLRFIAPAGAIGHLESAVLILLLLSVALSVGTASAQKMPLALVEGSRYTRRTINAQGREEACQEIEVSRLAPEGTELVATLSARPCEAAADSSASSRATIRCQIEDAGMVMNAVALLGPEGRSVTLRVTGGAVFYPAPPAEPVPLGDVTLEADVVRGVLGFLGGRSRIDLQDRQARPSALDAPAGAFTITETVRLRAYVLGVRVKDRRYRAAHTLLPDGRLVRQILTDPDGGMITLERIG